MVDTDNDLAQHEAELDSADLAWHDDGVHDHEAMVEPMATTDDDTNFQDETAHEQVMQTIVADVDDETTKIAAAAGGNADTTHAEDSRGGGFTGANMVDYITSNMDFTLSCEIGKLNVSLNELLNFKPGQSLNFNLDLQQVKIMVNSVVIGFGQLVEVDGKYGIKITKVLSITDSFRAS